MKLAIILDDDTVNGTIEDIDEYDLSNPMGRLNLLIEVETIIQQAKALQPNDDSERAAAMARHPAGKGRRS